MNHTGAASGLATYRSIHSTPIPLARDKCAEHMARVMSLSAAELALACEDVGRATRAPVQRTADLLLNFLLTTCWTTSSLYTSGPERGSSLAGLVFVCYCYNMEMLRLAGELSPTARATDYPSARRALVACASHPIADYSQQDVLTAWTALSRRALEGPDPFQGEAHVELAAYRRQLMLVTASIIVGLEGAAAYPHAARENSQTCASENTQQRCVGTGRLDIPSTEGFAAFTHRLGTPDALLCVSPKFSAIVMHCMVASEILQFCVDHVYRPAAIQEGFVVDDELDVSAHAMETLLYKCVGVKWPASSDGAVYAAWLDNVRAATARRIQGRASAEAGQQLRGRVLTLTTPPHLPSCYAFNNVLVHTTDRARFRAEGRATITEKWLNDFSVEASATDLGAVEKGLMESSTERAIFTTASFIETLFGEGVDTFNFVDTACSVGVGGMYRDMMRTTSFATCPSTGGAVVNSPYPSRDKAIFSTSESGAEQLGPRWRRPPLLDRAMPCLLFYYGGAVLICYKARIARFSDPLEAVVAWLLIVLAHEGGRMANDPDASSTSLRPAIVPLAACLADVPGAVLGRAAPAVEAQCKQLLKTFTVADICTSDGAPVVSRAETAGRFVAQRAKKR